MPWSGKRPWAIERPALKLLSRHNQFCPIVGSQLDLEGASI